MWNNREKRRVLIYPSIQRSNPKFELHLENKVTSLIISMEAELRVPLRIEHNNSVVFHFSGIKKRKETI